MIELKAYLLRSYGGSPLNSSDQKHARVPYNKLFTNLASSSRTGECWPSIVLVRPRCAQFVLPRPRTKIPQYGPPARLVFLRNVPYFHWPVGRVKIQTTSKKLSAILNNKTAYKRFINCYFITSIQFVACALR